MIREDEIEKLAEEFKIQGLLEYPAFKYRIKNLVTKAERVAVDKAIEIFKPLADEPMTGNVVMLELKVLRDSLSQPDQEGKKGQPS